MFEFLKKSFTKTTKSLSDLQAIVPFRLTSFKSNWSGKDLLDIYEISLYLNKAIEKRADKIGEIEFQLLKGDKEVKNDLIDKLYKPNEFQTGREFWQLWSKYYDIFGEAYIYVDKTETMRGIKINSMHHLRPDLVKPHFDKTSGKLVKLEYQTASGTIDYQGEDVIYWNRPNPENPLRGQSLIKSGLRSIQTSIQIDEYHAKVLQNGGRVEGIFKAKHSNLTRKQLDELKDEYDRQYSEAKNAGRPLFLSGDLEYENLGLNPSELSYLATKNATLNDIVILTGVPKTILGSVDEVKYDNADASTAIFLRETIKPILTSLTSKLDEFLFPNELNLTYIDPTPENIESKIKVVESGMKYYYLTPNEARKELGFDPIEGGDEIKRPTVFGNIAEDTETEKFIETHKVKTNEKKFIHPLSDEVNRRAYEKLSIIRQDRNKKRFKLLLNEYFKGQKQRLIDLLAPEKTRVFRKKDLVDELFNTQVEIQIAKEIALPLMEQLILEAGENAKLITGSDFEFNFSSEVDTFMNKKSDIFAKQINDTTFKKLKSEFKQSLEAGETRAELITRIENTYGDITRGRAEVIAQTETNALTQYATLEAYKQGGLEIKIWVTVGDGKVRDSHASLDGEERPINQAFSNGLMYPSDSSGGAGEVINCRCVI